MTKNDFNIVIQCNDEKEPSFFDKILKFLQENLKEVRFVKIKKKFFCIIRCIIL